MINSSLKASLIKLEWVLSSQLGIDARRFFRAIAAAPRFLRDFRAFRPLYSGKLALSPCLHDWNQQSGAANSEYFWQDLLVAQWVYQAKPEKHLDIGSRIDGFVGHIASFREIEVFDVRPLNAKIPGVSFRQVDLMNAPDEFESYCDSVSCLHALEHFGLGRYGDPIEPGGYTRGINSMARILKEGGILYLSVPIGPEHVEFNAGWVLSPATVIRCAAANRLTVRSFTSISGSGIVETQSLTTECLGEWASKTRALGLFTFMKESWRE